MLKHQMLQSIWKIDSLEMTISQMEEHLYWTFPIGAGCNQSRATRVKRAGRYQRMCLREDAPETSAYEPRPSAREPQC